MVTGVGVGVGVVLATFGAGLVTGGSLGALRLLMHGGEKGYDRNVLDGMRRWDWATEHAPLPDVDYVIRRRPGADDEPTTALRAELQHALGTDGAPS